MRPGRLELPRPKRATRPSTLRVYQFRHRRLWEGEYSHDRGKLPLGMGISALPARVTGWHLKASARLATLFEHMFVQPVIRIDRQPPTGRTRSRQMDLDLTKRQQEIFDFIKRYAVQVRLSADGARDRQGGRAGQLVDGARPPREPREVRAAAAQPDQAARDRAADRQGQAGDGARGRAAARRPGRRRAPVLAEENIEEYIQVPDVAGGDEGEYVLRVPARACATPASSRVTTWWSSRRRPRSTATSSSPCWARRRRSSASSARRDHVRLQPENSEMEPILIRRRAGAGQGRGSLQEGLR